MWTKHLGMLAKSQRSEKSSSSSSNLNWKKTIPPTNVWYETILKSVNELGRKKTEKNLSGRI
jgi:hypothetical protein